MFRHRGRFMIPSGHGFEAFNEMYKNMYTQNDGFPHTDVYVRDNKTKIVMALAGYKKEDLSIYVDKDELVISGEYNEVEDENFDGWELVKPQRKIAKRSFEKRWSILNDLGDLNAEFVDGILTVIVSSKEPETTEPKRFEIN